MDLEIMLKRPQLDDTQDGRPQRVGVGRVQREGQNWAQERAGSV